MSVRIVSFIAVMMSLAASAARADYKCEAPPTRVDARACEAAAQGPAQLRQFIQRMRVHQDLYFYDYVDTARVLSWNAQEQRAAQRQPMPAHDSLAAAK